MATATSTATSVAAALLLSLLLARARGDDDYSGFVYAGCSQGRYASGTQYASDVDSVLTSVANSAPYSPYANFTSPTSNSVVGVYQCRSDLPASVCTGCVRSAISRLSSLCAWATGGAVQLRACFVRYGNDTFLGKQDTAVLFKKCGGSPGDRRRRRHAGLGARRARGRRGARRGRLPRRRVRGRAGHVALKAGCGYATAGEVYLGKCYARFWGNGGGGFSSGAAGDAYGSGHRVSGNRFTPCA
ncbi:hypothetical protein OsJ_08291 [Oryza sativa Japonica Group]|uniref:Gnk2-homologous domain-containing protein n=1 Tax=Oryza sativa subsp. japonica TaxID=39947 RepID=A3AB41_ORYSJ|nr:hypothetical protein OsJ_08291 [Oryza sativa Japonica Group]